MTSNLLPRLKTVSLTSLIQPRSVCASLLKVEGIRRGVSSASLQDTRTVAWLSDQLSTS
jgi:tRNA(Arg) A34 adenosine deaminase TadA